MMVTGMIPSTCKLAKLLKSLLMPLAWLKAGNTKWYKHVTLFFFAIQKNKQRSFSIQKELGSFFHSKRRRNSKQTK
jgi:hypothetical protein